MRVAFGFVAVLSACFLFFAASVLAATAPRLPAHAVEGIRADDEVTGTTSALKMVQQAMVSAGIGAADPRHHARLVDDGYLLASPRQGLQAAIASDGIAVRNARGGVRMQFASWGCAAALVPAGPARVTAELNRVERVQEGLTDWYVAGPLGIEQGFTVERAARGCERASELWLELDVAGEVESGGGEATSLLFPEVGLRYRSLMAFDAGGRELSARLVVEGPRLRIATDVTGASWPVVVDPLFEDAKLLPTDGAAGDAFGVSVAVFGGTIVVGARGDLDNPSGSGTAYVFVEPAAGWNGTLAEAAKLLPSDGAVGDRFGESVAVSGGTIVIGAPEDDDSGSGSGSAYVFIEPAGGWTGTLAEDAKLLASDGASGDSFGGSVAVSDGTIVVGARRDDENGSLSGSAYVFVEPAGGWAGTLAEDAKLLASDGAESDLFGDSIAVSGGTIVVGAPHFSSPSAYVFVEPAGGWTGNIAENAKLLPSDGAAVFGRSVAVSGGTIVVGAPGDDDLGVGSGSVLVFVEPAGGWIGTLGQNAKLLASDGRFLDLFGSSVAVSGGTIVVGAPSHNHSGGSPSGSAYVFTEPAGGWTGTLAPDTELLASDGAAGDGFGGSVAVSGGTIVVGALGDDDNGSASGSAYVFVQDAVALTEIPTLDQWALVLLTLPSQERASRRSGGSRSSGSAALPRKVARIEIVLPRSR